MVRKIGAVNGTVYLKGHK